MFSEDLKDSLIIINVLIASANLQLSLLLQCVAASFSCGKVIFNYCVVNGWLHTGMPPLATMGLVNKRLFVLDSKPTS